MKIAFVSDCYWPRVNGVTVSIQTFRDQLERLGHDTLVLAPSYPGAPVDPLKPKVRRFPSMSALISKEDRLALPGAFRSLARALDDFNPDLVHFNTEFALFQAGKRWCASRGRPVFVTCHTNWEFYIKHYAPWLPTMFARGLARFYMQRAYRSSDYILIPSPQMGQLLASYSISGPFHVLPTGIDPALFSPKPERVAAFRSRLLADAPHLAGKKLLLFVGRIGDEKNLSFLPPVLARVRSSRPDAALVLIGDGPYRHKILAEATAGGWADSVHAPGYMDRADLGAAYAAADVFVFPSKTETQGLTTIEAMMCGTPVVAIGAMGTLDVMQGDNGGFMVPDDHERFAQAVLRLLDDPALHAAKSAEARAWASRFSVQATTDSLLGHYRDCLEGKGRRERA